MSREECFKNKWPYPPSGFGASGVQEVLEKNKDMKDRACSSLWQGLLEFGLSKVPLPKEFQVLDHSTEEAYLVIKQGRWVIKYLRRSLWNVAADMVQTRCRMTELASVFNRQQLMAEGIIVSPFVGGPKASRRQCTRIQVELLERGFKGVFDLRPSNVRWDSTRLKVLDFVVMRWPKCYPMHETYPWGEILADVST